MSAKRAKKNLEIPPEYTRALEEVLRPISGAAEPLTDKRYLKRLAKEVASISEGLTRDRAGYIESRYLRDSAVAEAYLAYYTTTNLLKLWPPLRELALGGFFAARTELRVLDLGTGTGAAVWGLLCYLVAEQPQIRRVQIVATDRLLENLHLVERFASHILNHLSIKVELSTQEIDLDRRIDGGRVEYDLVTMMNVVNEIDEGRDQAVLERVKELLAVEGALIFVEPSAKPPSRRALRFRDHALAYGFFVFAPCTRSGNCPALDVADGWCHTEFDWHRPDFIEAIDEMVGTLRLSLKSTYGILTKVDRNLSDVLHGVRDFCRVGRVVSERLDEKGRSRFFLCNQEGRHEYLSMKRDRATANRAAAVISRYDLIDIEGAEVRPHDRRIGPEAVVNILSDAFGSTNCG